MRPSRRSPSISRCTRNRPPRQPPSCTGRTPRQPDIEPGGVTLRRDFLYRCASRPIHTRPFRSQIMLETPLSTLGKPRRDLSIASIQSTIVDVPTVRKHKLSSLSVTAQSYVIVQLRLANGVTGIGEAATLGGPLWAEESVESIKATIDTYLAPALLGASADRIGAARARMDAAAKRNNAAKGAIESALFDAVGITLGISAAQLLGGVVRDRVPV